MANLERLVAQSEKDATVTNLIQDSLNDIQSSASRFHELEKVNHRVINESKELLEMELVSISIKTQSVYSLTKINDAINSIFLFKHRAKSKSCKIRSRIGKWCTRICCETSN